MLDRVIRSSLSTTSLMTCIARGGGHCWVASRSYHTHPPLLSVFQPEVHVQVYPLNAQRACVNGCKLLKGITCIRLQVLESRPLREGASSCLGPQTSRYGGVQRHLEPRLDSPNLEPPAEIPIVQGIAKEEVEGFAGGTPRSPVDWEFVKKRICLTIKPVPELGGV